MPGSAAAADGAARTRKRIAARDRKRIGNGVGVSDAFPIGCSSRARHPRKGERVGSRGAGKDNAVQRDADDRGVTLRVLVETLGVASLAWAAAALVLAAAGAAAASSVIRHERLDEPHLRVAAVTLAGLFCGGAAVAGLRLLEQRRKTLLPLGV